MKYIRLLLVVMAIAVIDTSLAGGRLPPLTVSDYIRDVCTNNCVEQESLLSAVAEASEHYDVDKTTLIAIVKVESGFNTKARNGNSVGLSQVHLKYHRKKFKNSSFYSVRDNILVGASIFKECLLKHNGIRKALRCYNGKGDPRYVEKVMVAIKEIRMLPGYENTERKVNHG